MEESAVQLEINTLLHQKGIESHGDIINNYISENWAEIHHPVSEGITTKSKPLYRPTWKDQLIPSYNTLQCGEYLYSTGIQSSPEEEVCPEPEHHDVTVNGADIGDFPAQYVVCGLECDELPVIGTYVDQRITPGFKYRVHVLGNAAPRYLFEKALYLQNIGRGYGKRITFESPSLTQNFNYFYSDTNADGYGFRLTAIETGDQFVILGRDGGVLGQGTVKGTMLQKETHTQVETDCSISKQVTVKFTCAVTYGTNKHGLVPLCSEETLTISGTALVMKLRGSRKAFTKTVRNITLPHYGLCVLSFST